MTKDIEKRVDGIREYLKGLHPNFRKDRYESYKFILVDKIDELEAENKELKESLGKPKLSLFFKLKNAEAKSLGIDIIKCQLRAKLKEAEEGLQSIENKYIDVGEMECAYDPSVYSKQVGMNQCADKAKEILKSIREKNE